MPEPEEITTGSNTVAPDKLRPRRRGRGRVLALSCPMVVLLPCVASAILLALVKSGPVELRLPGSNTLKLGSDNFVLSNYSFQQGSTYFIDLNGNGVRNIVEMHLLSDTRKIEIVLHHATKEAQQEHEVLSAPMP